jgi:hypothetical protein
MSLNLLARIAVVLIVMLPQAALAEAETPPTPERNPFKASGKNSQQPSAKSPEQPVLPGDAPTVAWTDAEIAQAKAKCAKLLAGVDLDYEPLEPIKEGRCGAPAPILLRSVGSDPKVAIEPPATVTCSVAVSLGEWLDKTVQPAARTSFNAQVVKLANASSYVCRNRYNGTDTILSEHALANALDISTFVLESGERLTVLAGWPRLVEGPPLPRPNPIRVADSPEMTGSIASSRQVKVTKINAVPSANAMTTIAKSNPFALPKVDARTNPFVLPKAAASRVPPLIRRTEFEPLDAGSLAALRRAFLTKVHDDACGIFGTVLGPEANDAHKDHFHLDMKARSRRAFCE